MVCCITLLISIDDLTFTYVGGWTDEVSDKTTEVIQHAEKAKEGLEKL